MKKLMIVFAAIAIIASCKKAGTGGSAIIAALIRHHDTPIKGATLYVKFNAEELPSDPTNNYDLKIVGASNEDHVHLEGMKKGKYYLYAEGFDSTIMMPVKGGVGHKIKWSERKKEVDVTVPVTE